MLLRTLGGHRRAVALALLLTGAGSLVGLLQPLTAMRTVRAAEGGHDVTGLALVLVAVFLAHAVLSGLGHYTLERTSESIVYGLRCSMIGRLLRLRLPVYQEHRLGDLISRVNSDTVLLRDVIGFAVIDVASGVIAVVGGVAMMLWLDPVLFGVVLATVTVAGLAMTLVLGRIGHTAEHASESVGAMAADLERALSAIRTVRASRAEDREEDRIGGRAEAAYTAGVRVARLESVLSPAVELAANGSLVLVLLVGGVRVTSGSLALSELVAFLLYTSYLAMPLAGLFQAAGVLQKGLASLRRISLVDTLPVESEQVPRPAAADPVRSGPHPAPVAELRDVWFGYPGRPVLRGVSLTVPARGQVALVGASGAGKSTVISLLARFHDPERGVVLLGGRDTATELTREQCRTMIGLVEQDSPVLFGTLRENLVYAAPEAGEAEIRRVVGLVNLDDLVNRLPAGLETDVWDHGQALSGGERQRVAIARALLTRPALLLLDEPTSQLDRANEAALVRVMERVSTECALLVVAHRVSTVRDADLVIVLHQGRIVASGTHEELLADDPHYQRLVLGELSSSEDAPVTG